MQIIVFRFGHRIVRDKRISTHCALVSRALGAKKIIYCGQEDPDLEKSVSSINRRWGSDFSINYEKNYMKTLEELKKNNILIHLTMYGQDLVSVINEVKNRKDIKDKGIVLIIGSQKVPLEIYDISDYNVSVTNQPHSEVAALSIALDRLNPEILNKNEGFTDAKIKVIGTNRPKLKK